MTRRTMASAAAPRPDDLSAFGGAQLCRTCGRAIAAARARSKYCDRDCYRNRVDPVATFWSKVDRDGPIPPHAPDLGRCWSWTGRRTRFGHGMSWDHGSALAHRQSWEIHNGPIMDGLWVLHRCDNPPCVRPDHLFLGTNADNVADQVAKGRHPRGVAGVVKANGAHLTPDIVRGIRAASPGSSHRVIARRFGVSRSTVMDVLAGRTWAWVE